MVHYLLPLVTLATVLPTLVSAHGQLRGATIAGTWVDAPNLYYDGDSRNQNTPIRKGYKADYPSYLLPSDFNNDNKMACQEAGAAPAVFTVKPGDEVKWKWEGATPELSNQGWPMGTWVHAMGFTSTWIAKCDPDCKSADASQLGWQKIDFNGLNPGNIVDNLRSAMANKPEPYRSQGLWGMAQLIENDSQYSSWIPQGLKNGEYMLRSELSAVHNPLTSDPSTGPQNYVGCLQVKVENGGDVELPYGTKAGSLYSTNGDYAKYSVFTSPASFAEPGPSKWNGASASGGNSNPGNSGNTGNSGSNDQGNNNGQQNQGNNNGQQQNQDQGNQNQNQGGNSGNNGQSGDNSNNSGSTDQGNQDQGSGNQNQDQNQNQGGNTGSGNSSDSGNGAKQCRRRSNGKRSIRARSLHAAHSKRHH